MVAVTAKSRTITNNTTNDGSVVEAEMVELYNNDQTLATAVTNLESGSMTISGSKTFSGINTFSANNTFSSGIVLGGVPATDGEIGYDSDQFQGYRDGSLLNFLMTGDDRHNLSIQGSNYSVVAGDLGKVLAGAGTLTLTLPDSSTLGSGWYCYLANTSTGVVTISATAQTIDGLAQIKLGPRNGCFLYNLGVSGFGTVGRKPEYIQLCDQKSSGTAGGTFTSGAWRTRDLNTEVADTANNCVLSSNQFTLQPGTYRIFATAPAHSVAQHQAKLRNITDSSDTLIGTSQINASGSQQQGISIVSGRFSISSAKTFELQHQCNTTRNTDGFGQTGSFATEVYAVVELWKEI